MSTARRVPAKLSIEPGQKPGYSSPEKVFRRVGWKGLERGGASWEIPCDMYAVKVDKGQRLRLTVLRPGDYYEPEILNPDQITLRRVPPPRRPVKLTKAQALAAIGKSRLRFTQSWDQLKEETRA